MTTPRNTGFVNGMMKRVKSRRVHFLGFTRLEYLKKFRPYMCDTSSWEYGARMGAFKIYAGRGETISIHKKDFATRPPQRVLDAIESYGIDPSVLSKNASWYGGYSINRTLNAASVVRMSMDIEKHLGTKFFCAVAAQIGTVLCLRGYEQEMTRRGLQ